MDAIEELLGFNPCFCGTRARTLIYREGSFIMTGFQSLFLWNSRPDPFSPYESFDRCRVSILVFVELAPGHPDSAGPLRS